VVLEGAQSGQLRDHHRRVGAEKAADAGSFNDTGHLEP
jgi:hypothetical protein